MTAPTVFGSVVYFLCFIASTAVMALLLRNHRRTRSRLVLWSALAFIAFALNNMALFFDMVVFPTAVDLRPLRDIFALTGVGLLIYGFVWKGN